MSTEPLHSSKSNLTPLTPGRTRLHNALLPWVWGFLLCVFANPLVVEAKGPSDGSPAKESRTGHTKSKKTGANKLAYQRSPAEETPAEHDRRMFRECKGMHNAGACRGYTR